ncbi:MAG: nucleoside phosphorylase [Bacteroidales bacterium]|nr:nucleoside phosphorylase [Bacteroidales bacterium]
MEPKRRIPESELVLNPDGSVYHLKLKPENLADTVLVVGDPRRVLMITDFFDRIEYEGQNREILTRTGIYKNKRLTVMSTGMGTDNIDIVLNELDALVNVDLENRVVKSEKKSLKIVRLGTSGALQTDIPLNSVIVSEYGLGFDGLVHYYQFKQTDEESLILDAFMKQTEWPDSLPKPYLVPASSSLMEIFNQATFFRGITATASGFYGPQGRYVRLPLNYPDLNKNIQQYRYLDHRILNFEMETSALYGLSRLLGHEALTLCVAIASRAKKEYNQSYNEVILEVIKEVLNTLCKV